MEKQTPLYAFHVENSAKIVSFAGYQMPVQYQGVLAEHKHTREAAGLFDVSHMGQCVLSGDNVTEQLQTFVPADLSQLGINQQVYSLLMNEDGGIDDDLIICRWAEDTFFIVVNAACKEADFAKFSNLENCDLRILDQQALVALQGPKARAVLSEFAPEVAKLNFMSGQFVELLGARCYITCSGYTGEDGYEISCSADDIEAIAKALVAHDEVQLIGLGARDSLRLEAGLCLYGHDLSTTTTPIEAGLIWAIPKTRRNDGGYTGSHIVEHQIQNGAAKKRIGLIPDGRAPVREGVRIVNSDDETVGHVCSGTFSPTLAKPIAMAYVNTDALEGELFALLRGKKVAVTRTKLPFVQQRYIRNAAK